ncbi:MAG TPA: sulfotransferase, partial [Longimicrobium sp.]|nr:sulfotransferase [Longimicrobium sp.]
MTETLHASAPPAPAAPAAEPRYAFVLYDSRSGSTLFAALLNRYRGVSVSLESAFVSRVVEYGGPLRSAADLEALADYLFAEVQFAELGLARPEVVAALRGAGPPYGKRELARALLELYFGRRDPEALVRVVKNPPFFYVGLLEEWLPGVRFVHVVRDGRAVYNSKRSSRSISGAVMQPNLVKAARDWRRAVRIAERHPASVLTVRYEDLVRDPDAVMARVLDHLGVPPEGRA